MVADNLFVTVHVRIRWWVPVYLNTLVFFCVLFRTLPDEQKLIKFLVEHGFRFTVK